MSGSGGGGGGGDVSRIPSPCSLQRAPLQILPVTVSQLLSAPEVGHGTFVMCDWELNQVSVVGIIRGVAPFVTYIQYSVDDMTGPPLKVKLWVHTEDCLVTFFSPGTYVKVTGSLRNYSGERSLLAMYVRRITNLNEITSHMLEVVHAHMKLFGKTFDINMNTAASSRPGTSGAYPADTLPRDQSEIQGQVLQVIRKFSALTTGISLADLKAQLYFFSMKDIRTSLALLVNKGHVFHTIDEQHFKSAD